LTELLGEFRKACGKRNSLREIVMFSEPLSDEFSNLTVQYLAPAAGAIISATTLARAKEGSEVG
jgi:hypothetical protein